jgi:ribulose-5-phosphate 4-epimerase/fuculose-1-phosphate aldolase
VRSASGFRPTSIAAAACVVALVLAPCWFAEPAFAQASPTSATADQAAVDDLVAANHILADQGVVDGFGHISVRHPSDPNRFLMSRSLAPALVKAEDIMEFDLDGKPVDQRGRAVFLERFIHSEIYKSRPDVKSVVHSHSPAVIPFGISQTPMKAAYHIAAFLAQGVPVFDIRKAGGMTDMLVRDGALGKSLAEVLGDRSVALMRGHGNVVVGPTIPLTVFRAVYTEVNARVQAQAIALGGPVTYLEVEEGERANKALDQIHLRAWDLWKRTASEKK